ncbi:carbamoyl phosphate synthase small subunit [Kytococcus schroeteri]|uniref:Carbamoyl phosphate synthase small chain n=1 Tax=Kytococcus schroeteri TaxID=138300 RepID=A0A2I1P9W6_9MICO|nr:glutamine-hydrolyzing carbamoyl-phosphate synthase small subunit [Kytococcus schroeteri]PKZ41427.1 carbamoyl phosphate synthase small subunit [Kytococcus schroeteri]
MSAAPTDRFTPEPGLLVLEDGETFAGHAWGTRGTTLGEIVFTTGMTGYQETLTDPSFAGQIVALTAPHVGNTGWNDEDDESRRIFVEGLVVRDPALRPSNWRSQRTLEDELERQGVVGLAGVDTRALTRHLRTRGAMRAGVFTGEAAGRPVQDLVAEVRSAPAMAGRELASTVSTPTPVVVPAVGEHRFTVAAVDLGIKSNTPRLLAARGIEVHVLPASSTLSDVLAVPGVTAQSGPDGVFFSNGPGDPATADTAVELLRGVLEAEVPFFGICFGNQLLGRALGFGTYKLDFGHRGINQPVMDRTTGKVEITAQNHGFAVDAPLDAAVTVPHREDWGRVWVSHVGLNDQVVEGLEMLDRPAFSVQYHPEAAAGPHDSEYLFDRFVELMTTRRPADRSAQTARLGAAAVPSTPAGEVR